MPAAFEVQGFGYTSLQNGAFGTEASAEGLDEIAAIRGNAVAITSTYWMSSYTSSDIYADPKRTEAMAGVIRTIEDAHSSGLNVMLKPHVDALDGRPRMQFTPANVDAWFADYKALILDYARVAEEHGVETLAIGTELDGLAAAPYRHYWVDIIDSVRAVYAGKLTYGANWDGASKISFWDRLDIIGIDGYAPVSFATKPSMADLVAGWTAVPAEPFYAGVFQGMSPVDYYRHIAELYGKPLYFSEIGYRSVDGAAARPFDVRPIGGEDQEEQAALYQAFFQVWADQGDWFKGAYFWHWSPLDAAAAPTDYQVEGKLAEDVVQDWFAGRGRDVSTRVIDRVLTGGTGDDTLVGGIGDELIDGRGSAWGDRLAGGSGDDILIVHKPNDRAVEHPNDGTDAVYTDLSVYALPANIEVLRYIGDGAFNGTGNALANTLEGDGGADSLSGVDGNDVLRGAAGNDFLLGGFGVDTLQGGKGDDLLDGGREADRLDGGSGFDTARFGAVTSGMVTVTVLNGKRWEALLPDGTVQQLIDIEAADAPGGISATVTAGDAEITGSAATDVLRGGWGGDYLAGSAGNDSLFGGDGRDWLWAGAGEDVLDGGSGRDNLNGEAGNDSIDGGTGDDRITGNGGNDVVHAGEGRDWVGVWNDWGEDAERNYFPESGDDQIFGEAGDDVLSAGEGRDTVDGGTGNDYAAGEAGDDSLAGGDGLDWLWGGAGNDSLDGGEAKDNLNGEAGNDLILAGAGNDRITGNGGNDVIRAGAGNDWVGVWNDWGEDAERNYFPEAGADDIDGEDGNDVLSAGLGNDTVVGGAGNDYVAGEQDNDLLFGGDGIDWLWAGAGNDRLDGGAGADFLIGEGGADVFVFRALADLGDRIRDLAVGQGDRIDVSGLLDSIGYGGADPFADGRLTLVRRGGDTLLNLDRDGGGGGFSTVLVATIEGHRPDDLSSSSFVI